MQKKLTISIDETVYKGLYERIGSRKISKFIEDLVRPHVLNKDLDQSYKQMSRDTQREQEHWNGLKLLWRTFQMKRGEVWWVDFEPSVGGEIRKKSPLL